MHAIDCARPQLRRLMWLHKSGEPPGHPDHNIGYDEDVVDICPECSGATLTRLRHDCFDFEDVWDQYEWYELAPEDGPRMREVATQCPSPLDPFCRCDVHKSLKHSMRNLPASSWSTVFDDAGHKHIIGVNGRSPQFAFVSAYPITSPEQTFIMVKGMQRSSLRGVFITWPLLLTISLVIYFRNVHVAWPIDILVTLGELPATFFVAVVLVAFWRVVTGQKPPTTDHP